MLKIFSTTSAALNERYRGVQILHAFYIITFAESFISSSISGEILPMKED